MLRHHAVEPGLVTLHLRIVGELRAQFGEDSGDVCVGWLSQAIVRPLAVAPRGDESGAAKICKVSRNLWLIGPQNFNARTDTQFIIAQQMDEPQASLVSECFED